MHVGIELVDDTRPREGWGHARCRVSVLAAGRRIPLPTTYEHGAALTGYAGDQEDCAVEAALFELSGTNVAVRIRQRFVEPYSGRTIRTHEALWLVDVRAGTATMRERMPELASRIPCAVAGRG